MGGAMSSITINGDTSGSVILQAPAVSGSTTLTLPSTSGTVLTSANTFANSGGPTFSAYSTLTQSTSANVFLKVTCNVEEWDTNSNYDNSSTYRFTPTVAGYYQVSCFVSLNNTTTRLIASIYKNGSQIKKVFDLGDVAAVANGGGSAIVYCNGSSDYLELYARTANANSVISSGGETMFQAAMIRGA